MCGEGKPKRREWGEGEVIGRDGFWIKTHEGCLGGEGGVIISQIQKTGGDDDDWYDTGKFQDQTTKKKCCFFLILFSRFLWLSRMLGR